MKKVIMLAAFAIAAVSAMAQIQYVVSGTYDGNGKTVYLIDELTEKKIDSVVVADGKFAFSGTADKDALMAVKAKKNHWTTQFFNDGTPVSINLNDSTLKGSPQNERLTKINYELEQPPSIRLTSSPTTSSSIRRVRSSTAVFVARRCTLGWRFL